MTASYEFDIKVRYYETDGQGFVHHSNYFRYFELARIEFLEHLGYDYARLEASGYVLVVSRISAKYYLPSRFGDTLRMRVTVTRARGARIDHEYELMRGGLLIASGESRIACIDKQGNVQRLPPELTEAQ